MVGFNVHSLTSRSFIIIISTTVTFNVSTRAKIYLSFHSFISFHIFKEGSPSAMLIFKGPSITKLTKLNTFIT